MITCSIDATDPHEAFCATPTAARRSAHERHRAVGLQRDGQFGAAGRETAGRANRRVRLAIPTLVSRSICANRSVSSPTLGPAWWPEACRSPAAARDVGGGGTRRRRRRSWPKNPHALVDCFGPALPALDLVHGQTGQHHVEVGVVDGNAVMSAVCNSMRSHSWWDRPKRRPLRDAVPTTGTDLATGAPVWTARPCSSTTSGAAWLKRWPDTD